MIPDYDPATNEEIPIGQETVEVMDSRSPDDFLEVPDDARSIDAMTRDRTQEATAMLTGEEDAVLFEVLGWR